MAVRTGRGARNKGKRGEREVIDLLQPVVNQVYESHDMEPPTLQRNTLQSDSGGFDIVGLEWIALEVKRVEQRNAANIDKWWQQTCRQAKGACPVLIYRGNNQPWTIVMYGFVCAPCLVSCVVRVDLDTFMRWFRTTLNYHLSKETP